MRAVRAARAAMLSAGLALGACAGDSVELRPPVTITQTLKPGEVIECEGTIVRMGLPNFDFQVIGFATRKWSCRLRPA